MAKREGCGNDYDNSFEIYRVEHASIHSLPSEVKPMKRDEKHASGLFLGSEPLEGEAHERKAISDRDGKDLGGEGPKDSGDDDASDKSDSDSSDEGDSDGSDKGDGEDDSRDADGKD
jgi:hypothetical protein